MVGSTGGLVVGKVGKRYWRCGCVNTVLNLLMVSVIGLDMVRRGNLGSEFVDICNSWSACCRAHFSRGNAIGWSRSWERALQYTHILYEESHVVVKDITRSRDVELRTGGFGRFEG